MAATTPPPLAENSLLITSSLSKLRLSGDSAPPDSDLIDTADAISTMVDILANQPTTPPSLYVDLEGVNLSRNGSVSILQIYVLPIRHAYLIDVYTLKETAFSTQGTKGCTLKEILESSTIPKVFFDVRNDSDALYSHFKVNLAGIHDLQLMELATRSFQKKFINGLSKCIERDAPLSEDERRAWKTAKDKGVKLFAPEHGGSYEVFNERPLKEEIRHYCVQDVHFLPRLWSHYDAKLTSRWRNKVLEASRERVVLSQSASYNGKGQHRALAPTGWGIGMWK